MLSQFLNGIKNLMCEELKLIQTNLGIWKLQDWPVKTCSVQLPIVKGIYCIKNLITNKVLIGEGTLGGKNSRLASHINGRSQNIEWLNDLKIFNKDNFRLIWFIEENNEIKRKLIENKFQIYFKNNCYNTPRRDYPLQEELLNHQNDKYHNYINNIKERINNYTKIQKDYVDECWESNYLSGSGEYGKMQFKTKTYLHHVLMYILHYGNICGVSSVIHHKCNNKKCVNPKHLELTTHIHNIKLVYDCNNTKKSVQAVLTSKYNGVCLYKKYNNFISSIGINHELLHLGYYSDEIYAAQNRDYYIVKNNLLEQRFAMLNFHNIDYYNFKPWPMQNGKINKHLL